MSNQPMCHRAPTVVGVTKLYYITLHLVSYSILAVQLANNQNIGPCANVMGVCRQAPEVRAEIGVCTGSHLNARSITNRTKQLGK